MNEKNYLTLHELTKEALRRVKEDPDYGQIEKILDYSIISRADHELRLCHFEMEGTPVFGGNEGIYLGIYLVGHIDDDHGPVQRFSCITFKTLDTSLQAMKLMGLLSGMMSYHMDKVTNENISRFD